ncbi:hypothetical protein GIB67_037365 [Kingdonia uniflora]|uniref:pyruvate dehydrogenase (acetyl-transferring) n=1 Tax=Kingdonia uniflora TaxID=39325 RepID=A0A7J7M8D8_9MAGN|nr:hypothetical protein GIB67_037365 [Kingdonia uniflora]
MAVVLQGTTVLSSSSSSKSLALLGTNSYFLKPFGKVWKKRWTEILEYVSLEKISYKVTKGLAPKYGDLRVLNTPIAENSFTGMAIGAAMTGFRPIIEGMNMGFQLLAFNQISNNCGMLHYTSGGQFKIPVVIRGTGGGIGASLMAAVNENFHDYLDAPVACLSSQDVPTPYAGTLEEFTIVQPAQIVTAVELCQ